MLKCVFALFGWGMFLDVLWQHYALAGRTLLVIDKNLLKAITVLDVEANLQGEKIMIVSYKD